MASLQEELQRLNNNLERQQRESLVPPKPPKVWRLRLPFGSKGAVKKGKIIALVLGVNKMLQPKIASIEDGLIIVGKKDDPGRQQFGYESEGIYFYKKLPIVVVFEWRVLPVGGLAEDVRSRLIGEEKDREFAKINDLSNYSQQIMIRAIEKAEIEKEDGKKKFPIAIIFIVLGVIVALYLLMKFLGKG